MILNCTREIELKSGLMVYPYRVVFYDAIIDPLFVFAADDAEAIEIARFIAWRDFSLNVDSNDSIVDRIYFYDQYLDEIKGVARIDKKDTVLAQGQCF